jgi:SAM-dependent methyltransferase
MTTNSTVKGGWELTYRANEGGELWGEEPMPIIAEIATRARTLGVRNGLDLGCGDGRNLLALRQEGLDLAGLDVSPTALGRADRLLRAHGQRATLIVGDVSALPVASGSVDMITALDVAGQVPDPAPMLHGARRALHEGGLFVANFFAYEDETYGAGEEIAPHTFRYKDTLFRYFAEDEVRELFGHAWEVELEVRSWLDGPHGNFRPDPHRHVNYVAWARPR